MDEKYLIALEVALTSTFPQSFVTLLFALKFWGFCLTRPWRTITLYSIFGSACFFVMLLLPESVRPFSFIGYGSLILILLRELPLRDRILTIATLTILFISVEITVIFTTVSLRLANQEVLAADPRSVLKYIWIGNAALGVAAFFMTRYRLAPGKRIHAFLRQQHNRLLSGLVLLFVGNIIVSSAVFYYVMQNHPFAASYTLVVAAIVSVLILLFTIRSITTVKNQAILTTQETYVDEIHNLFTTIRGQRHDFLNHVQVIQAFVRKGKMDELERYVSELVGEIVEINDLLQIGHPALAALIKSKMVYALDRKIDFRYTFEGMDRIGRGIASVDYVKIAGNLLDNALDEVLRRPPEDRWVEIAGWTDADHFYLSVSNPVYAVSEEQKANMFVPGYTTKIGGGHAGLGLSIVRERVQYYQGELDVKTEEDQVLSFRIKLPLRMPSIAQ
ncbi:sensor histidine kinase [Paenibacillus sp.]|uniref:sensor histidine kinase n=1 Tax=Paenibacillus sp. TaxID=58172 RepID=UPI002D35391D|nr:ATP-binding protein [Paenibacillus sp.]HZG57583.1 ATP-binding protein [Paenibacillus sp.]